jgi:zinc transport system permease protein
MAFAGHGLAHAAFGGAAIALLLGGSMALGGTLFAVALAIVLALWTRKGRVTEDSAIGILVAASMALGVIFLSYRTGYTQDIFSFLFGNILAVLPGDLLFSIVVAALTITTILALSRPLTAATFHEDLARVEGYPVDAVRILLFILVATNVVAAMKLVGVILVSALLVVPGLVLLLFAHRFRTVQIGSVLVGLVAVLLGMFLSYLLDLPTGAVIALVLCLGYLGARLVVLALRRRRDEASTVGTRGPGEWGDLAGRERPPVSESTPVAGLVPPKTD